jgi:hypothetical protein
MGLAALVVTTMAITANATPILTPGNDFSGATAADEANTTYGLPGIVNLSSTSAANVIGGFKREPSSFADGHQDFTFNVSTTTDFTGFLYASDATETVFTSVYWSTHRTDVPVNGTISHTETLTADVLDDTSYVTGGVILPPHAILLGVRAD